MYERKIVEKKKKRQMQYAPQKNVEVKHRLETVHETNQRSVLAVEGTRSGKKTIKALGEVLRKGMQYVE